MNDVTLRIDVDEDMYNAIKNTADRNGVSVSEYIRRTLEDGAERAAAIAGREETAAVVRTELRRALMATENRIIKILSKATVAAMTDTHLSAQCIASANRRDVTETLSLARKAAVSYLQQKDGEHDDGEK
ncbi:MAG: hypothetical protein DDT35_01463 [Firmicutes bacterium]|nr:hypothetical protein [Bacillota bacterium]